MRKCAKTQKVCQNLRNCAKSSESMPKPEKVWESVSKPEIVWESVAKLVKIWAKSWEKWKSEA